MNEGVKVSRIPRGLVEGWDSNTIYSFQTNFEEPDAEKHESFVKPEIEKIVSGSFDQWSELRVQKIEEVVWEPWNQVTLVQFYVKDSY